MFIKREIRTGKAHVYRLLLVFKTSVPYNFFNFTPDNCVLCEAVFVFNAGHYPMSGANIQALLWKKKVVVSIRDTFLKI